MTALPWKHRQSADRRAIQRAAELWEHADGFCFIHDPGDVLAWVSVGPHGVEAAARLVTQLTSLGWKPGDPEVIPGEPLTLWCLRWNGSGLPLYPPDLEAAVTAVLSTGWTVLAPLPTPGDGPWQRWQHRDGYQFRLHPGRRRALLITSPQALERALSFLNYLARLGWRVGLRRPRPQRDQVAFALRWLQGSPRFPPGIQP
jgi:hypothetical protein